MKKLLFIFFCFFPLLCGITAVRQAPSDTIPPRVKQAAAIRTDKQIDSVYEKMPRWVDALHNEFNALRSYQDTLNAQAILREQAYEQAAIERDKAVQDRLIVIHQNTQLRMENKEKEKKIDFAKSASHYFMIFITVLGASYFGGGINNYINKRKKND